MQVNNHATAVALQPIETWQRLRQREGAVEVAFLHVGRYGEAVGGEVAHSQGTVVDTLRLLFGRLDDRTAAVVRQVP